MKTPFITSEKEYYCDNYESLQTVTLRNLAIIKLWRHWKMGITNWSVEFPSPLSRYTAGAAFSALRFVKGAGRAAINRVEDIFFGMKTGVLVTYAASFALWFVLSLAEMALKTDADQTAGVLAWASVMLLATCLFYCAFGAIAERLMDSDALD